VKRSMLNPIKVVWLSAAAGDGCKCRAEISASGLRDFSSPHRRPAAANRSLPRVEGREVDVRLSTQIADRESETCILLSGFSMSQADYSIAAEVRVPSMVGDVLEYVINWAVRLRRWR
jgi:hypothetical protein